MLCQYRFSCLSREYRYFFWKENLNIGVGKPFSIAVSINSWTLFCRSSLLYSKIWEACEWIVIVSRWLMSHQAMESAGTKFVGEHDFRNFCKMDAANVHNYRRHITMFEISPTDVRLRLVDNFSYPLCLCFCVCMFAGKNMLETNIWNRTAVAYHNVLDIMSWAWHLVIMLSLWLLILLHPYGKQRLSLVIGLNPGSIVCSW